MRAWGATLAFVALTTSASLQTPTPGFSTQRVFGPEVQTGPYKHPACLTELSNGDLYLVYYGGQGEYAKDTAVFGSRRAKGSSTWSAPRAIARDPFRSLGNGVVWQAPDGMVWLFYVVRYGATWSTSRIQAKVSSDLGETWSDAFMLHDRPGMMVRNRPIVLASGDYLLPIYHETGENTEEVGADSTSLFLRRDQKTGEWKQTGEIRSAKGNIQPAVVEVAPGRLIAYCRRGGGYGPTKDFVRLASGALLLVFNDSMSSRTPLVAALSRDNDRSYPHRRAIADGPGDFAYPIAFQATDGRIHVVYTSDRRRVINHAVFEESWVAEK
jgi:predicted neuraminidase